MHHEIIFFLFFQVFFLFLGLPYFFFITTWIRSISILLTLVVRRTLSTYKSNLVRLRTVSLSAQGGIVVKNRARKSPAN